MAPTDPNNINSVSGDEDRQPHQTEDTDYGYRDYMKKEYDEYRGTF